MSDKLNLWSLVEATDPQHTKQANVSGMTITAINPQSQRKMATAAFGPFGIGWGVSDVSHSFVTFGTTTMATYEAVLWYVWEGERGQFPIASTVKVVYQTNKGYERIDDEWLKKAATDALTKGLSFLGFNADVFMGLYDDNRYVNQLAETGAATQPEKLDDQKAKAELRAQWNLTKAKLAAIIPDKQVLDELIAGIKNDAENDPSRMVAGIEKTLAKYEEMTADEPKYDFQGE